MSELTKIEQSEKYPDETSSFILGNCYDKETTAEIVHRCNAFDDLLATCKMGLKLAQMLNHPDEHHIEEAIAKAEKS